MIDDTRDAQNMTIPPFNAEASLHRRRVSYGATTRGQCPTAGCPPCDRCSPPMWAGSAFAGPSWSRPVLRCAYAPGEYTVSVSVT